MNREAAALGVPVYSIFRGKIGAVDRYLADTDRLVLVESVDDVRSKIVLDRRASRIDRGRLDVSALRAVIDNVEAVMDFPYLVAQESVQ
jgi:predicted glycosyltransferase